MARLRVLSWNVHALPYGLTLDRPQRIGAIAQLIRAEGPDVVLLQELWLDEDLDYLERALVSYRSVPYDSPHTSGSSFWRWLGARLPGRKAGLTAFVRERSGWRLEGSFSREYSAEEADWMLWHGDGYADKGAQALELVHDSGARLLLGQTHLQAEYGVDAQGLRSVANSEIRRAQMDEVTEWLAAKAERRTVVLAGDFNTSPTDGHDRDAYLRLETLGWRELTAPERERCLATRPLPSWRCVTHLAADPAETESWIDFVLTLKGARPEATLVSLQVLANEAIDQPWSDHHGLLAELEIPEPLESSAVPFALAGALAVNGERHSRRRFLVATAAFLASRGLRV